MSPTDPKIPAPLAWVDCETTGLDAERHHVWEVGLILSDMLDASGNPREYHWFLGVDLTKADPMALAIGGFHDRHPHGNNAGTGLMRPKSCTSAREFAESFARLTHGHHLVGAVISFDEERLRKLLIHQGCQPSWHYHIIDIEAMAVGYLRGRAAALVNADWTDHPDDQAEIHAAEMAMPPWRSSDLSKAVGVDCDQFDKHTALGDARWAAAIYYAVMGT